MFYILVPWCKCHMLMQVFYYSVIIFEIFFFHVAMILCNVGPCLVAYLMLHNGIEYIFNFIGTLF